MKQRIKKALHLEEVYFRHYVKFILAVVLQTPFGLLVVLADKFASAVQNFNGVIYNWVRK